MPNPISPQQNSQMSAEDAKASLGIATMLMQQLMPKASPEATDSPQNAETPQTPQNTPTDEMTPRIEDLEGRFDKLEKEVKQSIKEEIGGIKEMIKKSLENGDEKEQTE